MIGSRKMSSPHLHIRSCPVQALIFLVEAKQERNTYRFFSEEMHARSVDRVKQLSSQAVIGQIQRALSFHRIPVELLSLEVTESCVMESMATTLLTIEALILLGLKLSIDDLGTGYSSLSYLKRLPIHTVEIDRSFVKELPTSREDAAIARSVISMAEGPGLGLVAEGVENEAQGVFFLSIGCPTLQGYLFAKPVPREQLECLIESGVPGACVDPSTSGSGSPAF